MPSAVVVAVVRDGAAASAGIPPASAAAGHFVVGPSVATEAAALEDDLSPGWWTHRPAPSAAIGEPFEHDSRSASGAGGRPAGGQPWSPPPRRAGAISQNPVDASAGRDCAANALDSEVLAACREQHSPPPA